MYSMAPRPRPRVGLYRHQNVGLLSISGRPPLLLVSAGEVLPLVEHVVRHHLVFPVSGAARRDAAFFRHAGLAKGSAGVVLQQ